MILLRALCGCRCVHVRARDCAHLRAIVRARRRVNACVGARVCVRARALARTCVFFHCILNYTTLSSSPTRGRGAHYFHFCVHPRFSPASLPRHQR